MSTEKRRRRGFANPEWLILLFGTLLVLAIVVPRVVFFFQRRSNLAELARLRADVAAYQAAHKGDAPATLPEAAGGPVPQPKLGHGHSGVDYGESGPDTGVWGYDNLSGRVWINCTHTDSLHKVWAAY